MHSFFLAAFNDFNFSFVQEDCLSTVCKKNRYYITNIVIPRTLKCLTRWYVFFLERTAISLLSARVFLCFHTSTNYSSTRLIQDHSGYCNSLVVALTSEDYVVLQISLFYTYRHWGSCENDHTIQGASTNHAEMILIKLKWIYSHRRNQTFLIACRWWCR